MFTYHASGIAPSGTDYVSAVRFIIQDTVDGVFELLDEEITALYDTSAALYGTTQDARIQRVYYTALECAKALHHRYARQATFSSAGTSVQLGERAKYWSTVVDELGIKLISLNNGGSVLYGRRDSLWR